MLSLFRDALGSRFDLLLSPFFRRKRVFGADRVPLHGPVVLLAPEGDALLDMLLLQCTAPRPVVPLARRGRFGGSLARALFRAFRALPLGAAGGAREAALDRETAVRVEHLLVAGRAVAVRVPLDRQGNGKISSLAVILGSVEAAASRGVSALLVPVDLTYSWEGLGRGEAEVVFGHARASGLEEPSRVDGEARRAVSAAFQKAIADVPALSREGEDLEILERLRALAAAGGNKPAGANGVELDRSLAKYREARLENPLQVRRLLHEAGRYFRLLDSLGISDDEVRSDGQRLQVPARTYARLLLAIGGLPAAFYGWLFHVLPYALSKWAGARWGAVKGPPSAMRGLSAALFLFPLCYAFQGLVLYDLIGWWRAALALLAAPLAGLWSFAFGAASRGLPTAAGALLRWRARGRLGAALLARRETVIGALRPLAGLFVECGAGGAQGGESDPNS